MGMALTMRFPGQRRSKFGKALSRLGQDRLIWLAWSERICADARSKDAGRLKPFKTLRQASPCKSARSEGRSIWRRSAASKPSIGATTPLLRLFLASLAMSNAIPAKSTGPDPKGRRPAFPKQAPRLERSNSTGHKSLTIRRVQIQRRTCRRPWMNRRRCVSAKRRGLLRLSCFSGKEKGPTAARRASRLRLRLRPRGWRAVRPSRSPAPRRRRDW